MMSDPSEEGQSSASQSSQNEPASAKKVNRGGFYASFSTKGDLATPNRPSFLDDSSQPVKESTSQPNLPPSTPLYSIPSATPLTSLSTTFGSMKRKRPAEIVEKPSFKVSEFVVNKPHLPKFGTSLTKIGSVSNQSKFYSGWTKFGGSSSLRENSAKRVKISPVSKGARTNITQITAKPYSRNDDKRTLTSKTAESILQTLNKICTPTNAIERNRTSYSNHSANFSTLSQRVREKRKSHLPSLPTPPISRLNHIKSGQVDMSINRDTTISQNITKEVESEIPNVVNEKQEISEMETIPPKIEPIKTKKIEVEKIVPISKPPPVVIPETAPVVIKEVPVVINEIKEKIIEKTEPVLEIKETPKVDLTVKSIPKQDDVLSTTSSKSSLKMKRQSTRDHYTVGKKDEEPVNTMPEVTAIQPLIITEMPKFDLTVKPSSATMFTPIVKHSKQVFTPKIITNKVDADFVFSTPKTVNDKNIDYPESDQMYSFISPIAIKNPIKSSVPIEIKKDTKDLSEIKPVVIKSEATLRKEHIMSVVEEKNPAVVVVDEVKKAPAPTFSFKLPPKVEGSWDCPTCMINNKPDCMNCVACTESKPGTKGTTSSNFSFGGSTVAPSTGFAFSKPAEDAPKVSQEVKHESGFSFGKPVSNGPIETETVKPNPFSKFSAASGSWSCPTCMINNSADVLKCVACTEPKPGSKPEETAPSLSSKPSFNFGATSNAASSGFSFGGAATGTNGFSFGAPASNTSSSGFSFGKTSDSSIAANTFGTTVEPKHAETEPAKSELLPESEPASKPLAFGSSTSSSFTFGAASKPPASEGFSFQTVAATANPFLKKTEEGSSFSEAKPEPKEEVVSKPVEPEPAVANPFMNLKKPEEGSWSCPTCMITNKPDCLKCAACSEQKPGTVSNALAPSLTTSSSFSFGKPPADLNGGSGGFSFQPSNPTTSIESNGFNFGSTAQSTTSSQFSFGSASSGFSFGKSTNGVSTTTSAGFSFGTIQSDSKEPKIQVTNLFGSQDANKVLNGPSIVTAAPTGFSFGAVSKPNIFSSALSSEAIKVNGEPALAVNSTPQFNFASAAKPSFLTNPNDNKPADPAKFNFNPAAMSTPNFNFGGVTSAAAIFGNPNPSGQFSFANNNNVVNGNNEPTKVNLFASPAAAPNLFTIGGGGSNDIQQNGGNERRKIKRAHRRLGAKK